MFDSNSIEYLKQSLGYEQWVLANCIDLLKRSQGKVKYRRYVIEDNHSLNVVIGVSDTFGLNRAVNVVNELSPLLFVAGYKILDMIMEWIIKENQGSCPWKFFDKIRILSSDVTFSLPYPLAGEPTIFCIFTTLYEKLAVYRNALTHGAWGKNHSGDLVFDFQKYSRRIQETIYFEQVVRFADCMSLTARQMIAPSTKDNINILSTIKLCLDSLQPIHNLNIFGITHISYFDVIRKIEVTEACCPIVDIKYIRQILEQDAMGFPYSYYLRVEAAATEETSTVWEISSSAIGNRDELILDSEWSSFIIS